MPFLCRKCPLLIKIYIWYYRLLQTTFGGLTINSSGQLTTNKYLKYYGYISGLMITSIDILAVYLLFQTHVMKSLYNSGLTSTYYLAIVLQVAQRFRVIVNLWFLQFNGIEFFQIFYHYKIERRKNKYLLFMIWICHMLMPIVIIGYQLYPIRNVLSVPMLLFILVQNFFSFSASWSVSFLMWNISIHSFESLVYMKNVLREQIDRNSGNVCIKVNFQLEVIPIIFKLNIILV